MPEPATHHASASPVSCDDLRSVMGCFVTGVTVVTMRTAQGPHGMTVNSFTSLSLDPPLVLVCLRGNGHGAALLSRTEHFGISILSHRQAATGKWFASGTRPAGDDAFARIPHRIGITGVALLDGSIAHLECRVIRRIEAGDHTIFVGEVISVSADADLDPLAFHRGRFRSVA